MLTLLAIGYLVATLSGGTDAAATEGGPPMMGRAQLMMFGGFVLLGWVLARRTMRQRKKSRAANRVADRELQKLRQAKPSVTPLTDAPPEIQRWQGAMYDLSRDLSAELENRIATVQSLINQADAVGRGNPANAPEHPVAPPITGRALTEFIRQGLASGRKVEEMAAEANVDPGEIRWSIAAMTPGEKVAVEC